MIDITITEETWKWVGQKPPAVRKKIIAELGKMEFERCADDVKYWLDARKHWVPYAYTKDEKPLWQCSLCGPETDGHHFNKMKKHLQMVHNIEEHAPQAVQARFKLLDPIRPFPYHVDRFRAYMDPLIDLWLQEQLLLVKKSRDMMASWLFITLYTWDTIYHKGRQNFFQSTNAAKSRDLVRRAYSIYRNQPKFLREVAKASYSIGPFNAGVLLVDSLDSELVGLPEGPDQFRQYHPSGVYTDETAFHKDAGETFAAVKPAVQAGGRYTGVSSAYPSWFCLACSDALDMDEEN